MTETHPKLIRMQDAEIEKHRARHFDRPEERPWYWRASFGLVKPRHWAYPRKPATPDSPAFDGAVYLLESTVQCATRPAASIVGHARRWLARRVVDHEWGHAALGLEHPAKWSWRWWWDIMGEVPVRLADEHKIREKGAVWLDFEVRS